MGYSLPWGSMIVLTRTLTLWLGPWLAVPIKCQPNGNWSLPLNRTSCATAISIGMAPTDVLILLKRMMGILWPRGRNFLIPKPFVLPLAVGSSALVKRSNVLA